MSNFNRPDYLIPTEINTFYHEPDFEEWKKDKSKKNMSRLVKKYEPLIMSELPKYKGNLPNRVMKAYAKKFAIDGVKTYNPEKAKLSTHIVLNLQRGHRVNYGASSTIRMSEELQRGVNQYKHIREYLTDKYNRAPSAAEIADELNWTISRVNRTEKMLKDESVEGNLEFSADTVSPSDEKLDFIYHDLDQKDKVIFENSTGYMGAPVLKNSEIATKLKMTPGAVSLRRDKIKRFVQKVYGYG